MDEPKFQVGDRVAKPLKRGNDRGTVTRVYYSYTVEWDAMPRNRYLAFGTAPSEEMEEYLTPAPSPSPTPKFKLGDGVKRHNSNPNENYWSFGVVTAIIITANGIDYEINDTPFSVICPESELVII